VWPVITTQELGGAHWLLTTCQTDHIILSHELDDVLQGRWMPSSALGVDVMREVWSHVVIFPDGVKLQDYVERALDYTPVCVVTCTWEPYRRDDCLSSETYVTCLAVGNRRVWLRSGPGSVPKHDILTHAYE
jgi:hypothetical protein